MAWDAERVKSMLQSRYKGRNVKDIWYGSGSHIVIVTFEDGSELPIRDVGNDVSEEKAANLIERAI